MTYATLVKKLKKMEGEHKRQFGGDTEESEVLAEAAAVIRKIAGMETGKWLYSSIKGYECSACGFGITDDYGRYRYCPGCGAEMKRR